MKKIVKKTTTKKRVVKKAEEKKKKVPRLKDIKIPEGAVVSFGYDMAQKEFMLAYENQRFILPRNRFKATFMVMIRAIKHLAITGQLVDSNDQKVNATDLMDFSFGESIKSKFYDPNEL